jgi:hypothetical protein
MQIRFDRVTVTGFMSRLKSAFAVFIHSLRGRVGDYFSLLMVSAKIRFLTFSWSVVIIFVGIDLLASINPLSMLIPGMMLPYPVRDQRSSVRMLVISRLGGGATWIQAKILTEETDEETLTRRIMFALSKPDLYLDMASLIQGEYRDLQRLPEFGYAVKKIWFKNDKGDGVLIIDLSETGLRDIARSFIARSGAPESSDVSYFDAYFKGLTETILDIKGPIKKILYLTDGESRSLEGMKFDFGNIHSLP